MKILQRPAILLPVFMKVVKSHLLRVLMIFANVYGTENPFLHAVRGVALNRKEAGGKE